MKHLHVSFINMVKFSLFIVDWNEFYENIISGTNKTLKDQLLNRIGGKSAADPHAHTFCLACSIPNEAIDQYAQKISFLLGKYDHSKRFVLIKI